MSELTTSREVALEMIRIHRLLEEAQRDYSQAAHESARLHAAYKKAWAQARVTCRAKTQGDKDDLAELETNAIRHEYEQASATEEVLKMSQHNLRKQLDALQACAYVLKGEMDLAGRGAA